MVSSKVADFCHLTSLPSVPLNVVNVCRTAFSTNISRLDNIRDASQQTFSLLQTQQTPVLFPQPTILVLGRCQRLLNGSLYGHLHMKQQPRYTVNRTHIHVYIAIQQACCPPVYSLFRVRFFMIYCHKTHDRVCGFSTTTSGVAPARMATPLVSKIISAHN